MRHTWWLHLEEKHFVHFKGHFFPVVPVPPESAPGFDPLIYTVPSVLAMDINNNDTSSHSITAGMW